MKILRISPSFASREYPGSGLNAYYHSINSREENLVLTEYKSATYMHVPSNIIIKPKKTITVGLGKPGKINSSRVVSLIKKFFQL